MLIQVFVGSEHLAIQGMFYRSAAKTSRVEAKVLARRLVVLLSTRVSVIVIVMVMARPAVDSGREE